jgi:DNA helicase-2/ATP-dependent DNA helicase PcrA
VEIVKIYGPPGTGKTYALLTIMEKELARGVKPPRLAYLSFTKQARREAMRRAMEKFKLTEDDLPNFRTLHAICYRELNMTAGGMVKGTNDLKELGDRLGLPFTYYMRHSDDSMMDMPSGGEVGDRLLQIDHVRRHHMLSVEEAWAGRFDDDLTIFQVRRFVQAYTEWKRTEGLRDFTDLLEQAEDALEVDVVIVDEAQDLSRLQWAALHRLCRNAKRMYIAGDDDQAIFTWAGADPSGFLTHPGKVRILGQSYRIPHAVHPLAIGLAEQITVRQPKDWKPRKHAGHLNYAPDISRLRLDPARSYLLLYRHHYLVENVETLVRDQGLPYRRSDRPAPGAEWGLAIIYWERLRKGKELQWHEMKLILDAMAKDTSVSQTGRSSIASLGKRATFSRQLLEAERFGIRTWAPWYEALTKIKPDDAQYLRRIIEKRGAAALTEMPKIRLSTIHAAKGAEADEVVLLTEMSNRTREIYEKEPDLERRVFYVGITRAKDTLTIVPGANNPLFT